MIKVTPRHAPGSRKDVIARSRLPTYKLLVTVTWRTKDVFPVLALTPVPLVRQHQIGNQLSSLGISRCRRMIFPCWVHCVTGPARESTRPNSALVSLLGDTFIVILSSRSQAGPALSGRPARGPWSITVMLLSLNV